MTADAEQPFIPLEPLRQVESLTQVSERVARKKDQENKRRRKRKSRRQIDEQLSDEIANEQNAKNDDHIDFRA